MSEEAVPYTVAPAAPPAPPLSAEAQESKKAFLAALAKAQGEFAPIVKNKVANIRPRDADKTPYKFTYADLGAILDAVRPALARNGLSTRGRTLLADGHVYLQSILAHSDGWEDISELPLNIEVKDIKELGIRIAYLRRYIKVLHLDLAAEDDADVDGEEAPQQGYSTQPARGYTNPPPSRAKPQPRAAAPKPAAAVQAAGAAITHGEPPAGAAGVDDTGPRVTSAQAKWIAGKLEAYFSPPEAAAWLKERGFDKAENVPAAGWDKLRGELVALD